MPRLPSALLISFVGSGCALLLACSSDSTGSLGGNGGSGVGGSSGASGSGTGGSVASAGSVGQAGSGLTAGAAGTGAGGTAGNGNGGNAGATTAGSGGSAGSAGSAAGGGGGAASCAGALFCDDFESYTGTPGMPWTVKKNAQGGVVIDSAQHQSGTKAVKFTTTGAMAYQQAFISLAKIFPVANNAFYGRMMIYTTKAPNDGVHWTMIQGEGAATAQGITSAKVRYGGQQQQRLMANYDSSGKASDCWQHSATKMPEGKWACMEWYFEGATNTQKFWLDGKAIDDLTVTGQGQGCISHDTGDKWIFPAFDHVSLGWESYQTDDAREVWIDDVALGTAKLGCPQ